MHKYRLVAKKGEGTFSEVLKAQSVVTGEYFAVKCMKSKFKSLEQVHNLREIQALKRLNPNPSIIQMEEILFDAHTGRLALVFELMECNIYELIRGRKTYLKPQKVKNLMYQLLKAIAHMHKMGIFHRDIKPENILIMGEALKVADFGSCRGMYSKPPFTEYISTRWYRAPECLLTNGYYDYKMDMWGVGCVFFEVVSLFPLFPGTNELDQIQKVHNIMGTPSAEVLAYFKKKSSHVSNFDFTSKAGTGLAHLIPHASKDCINLIESLLIYHPNKRITAKQALQHPYFRDLREAEQRERIRTASPVMKSSSNSPEKPIPQLFQQQKGQKTSSKVQPNYAASKGGRSGKDKKELPALSKPSSPPTAREEAAKVEVHVQKKKNKKLPNLSHDNTTSSHKDKLPHSDKSSSVVSLMDITRTSETKFSISKKKQSDGSGAKVYKKKKKKKQPSYARSDSKKYLTTTSNGMTTKYVSLVPGGVRANAKAQQATYEQNKEIARKAREARIRERRERERRLIVRLEEKERDMENRRRGRERQSHLALQQQKRKDIYGNAKVVQRSSHKVLPKHSTQTYVRHPGQRMPGGIGRQSGKKAGGKLAKGFTTKASRAIVHAGQRHGHDGLNRKQFPVYF